MADGRRKTRLPIHLRVIGRRDLLPEGLRAVVESSANLSHEDGTMDVTVALPIPVGTSCSRHSARRFARPPRRACRGAARRRADGQFGRRPPLYPRLVGAGPDHPHLGRGPPVGLPALAVGLLRAPVLRGLLARLPGDRLPARPAHVPAPRPPLRPLAVHVAGQRVPLGLPLGRRLGLQAGLQAPVAARVAPGARNGPDFACARTLCGPRTNATQRAGNRPNACMGRTQSTLNGSSWSVVLARRKRLGCPLVVRNRPRLSSWA